MLYGTENVVILACVVVSGNLQAPGLALAVGTSESAAQGEMMGKTPLLHMLSSQPECTAYP